MTVKERLLLLRLLERQQRQPEYAGRIGVRVSIKERTTEKEKEICSK